MESPELEAPRFPAPTESMVPTFRALVEASNAVMRISNRHIESLGLTPAQFDVLVTLGDTEGMTCKELGEQTLITKGTLTGVLDRLEAKGLVRRIRSAVDSRQIIIRVTEAGQAEYERTFDPHVAHLQRYFTQIPAARREALEELLRELKSVFSTFESE